ncbi:ABSCISIC ACID-INSENSITIVE 5-like protein 7 [Senna tora]|uniref:ABSCISIC ACID-INSENSITIVE 5-like protein 7 n=1 Tax=Senna tora TaxID=362788 RepID=A0A834SHH9_9FABA|nr:ABSCISIC ACID-INSENSITIVE 5-like protein 7 [Senna tora]
MASSKVATASPDLPRQSSLSSILADLSKTSQSMSMDDLLKFIYNSSEPQPDPSSHIHAASISRQGSLSLPKEMAAKTVDEVWKEIVEGTDPRRVGPGDEEMTLEDFLTKAGAVREDDVRGVPPVAAATGAGSHRADVVAIDGGGAQFPMTSVEAFENVIEGPVVAAEVEVSRRGKRRAKEEPMDNATLQKQRRMIKNRESAARSRERKQAYTVELEALVSQLEEEKARLLKEEADKNKERFKQLMEYLIPVVEKHSPRPRSMHRRINSV